MDGVLGLFALFTTMEPILEGDVKNLNQHLDVACVILIMCFCKGNAYKCCTIDMHLGAETSLCQDG
ncbi:MAG: hypothetical protein AUK50_00090 [Comamonadaceae bacterium CG2_30_57_122]|nr:MAG: hypothetical protein AUK50_00090 [Comamonadaceae bacterium CG2_30_57_122]